jgi:hypothetical protein
MSEELKITTAQYEAIIKRLDIMQSTQDKRFQDWDDTTKTITDIEVRLKTVEAKVEGARDDIHDQGKKLINRVDEHLEPIPEMMAEQVKTELNKKSMIDKIRERVKRHG